MYALVLLALGFMLMPPTCFTLYTQPRLARHKVATCGTLHELQWQQRGQQGCV